jgi:hypothetical protein
MAGADVLSARVDLASRGAGLAEVRLATATVPSGAVTLAFEGGLSFAGTVRRAAVDAHGAVCALVVGGADGLRASCTGHYRSGRSRDVLGAIARAAGETLASDIAAAVLAATWDLYSLAGRCHAALDTLAASVGRALGSAVTWRIRAGGDLWMGVEPWTATKLGKADAVLATDPALGLVEIGCQTPTIVPGIALDGVGNVSSVRHVIRHDAIRSFVQVAT